MLTVSLFCLHTPICTKPTRDVSKASSGAAAGSSLARPSPPAHRVAFPGAPGLARALELTDPGLRVCGKEDTGTGGWGLVLISMDQRVMRVAFFFF